MNATRKLGLVCGSDMSDLLERRWFVCLLGMIALALGGWLLRTPRAMDSQVLASQIPLATPSSKITFERIEIGGRGPANRITHVQVVDLNADGINDVLVCDAARNSVIGYQQAPIGEWTEIVLADELKAPAHATLVDIDQDGDQDIIVSVLGDIRPSDALIGKVVLLERQSDGSYSRHLLLDDVRRVADTQFGDFDGDGDIDLVVAVFGYARGEVLWLENRGPRQFRDHQLLYRPGIINVPVADLDQDGDLDISAIVSQEEEELWVFDNLGGGEFRAQQIYATNNGDVGSAGLLAADLDNDGDTDLLLPQGDNLEDMFAWPQPYHGCLWFENQGNWSFEEHTLAQFGGTYGAAVGDVDADGDQDVALVSLANDWADPQRASVVWLENDSQKFSVWKVDTDPIRLITVAVGDLNQDGRADIVAGGLHLEPLGTARTARITAWLSRAVEP